MNLSGLQWTLQPVIGHLLSADARILDERWSYLLNVYGVRHSADLLLRAHGAEYIMFYHATLQLLIDPT